MVEATIDVIDRGRIRADANYVIDGETLADRHDQNPNATYLEIPVISLVIDHPEGTILWDTGSHPDAGNGHWPAELYDAFHHYDAADHRLADDLAAAGYSVAEIDAVFQSHLHIDHAGGLAAFDGTDVPVYVHEAELKFAYYSAKTPPRYGDAGYVLADFDHDLDWHVIRRDREQHFADVEFVHLPGHTPGMTGTVVHLDDPGTIVIAGDQAFFEANYRDGTPLGATLLWDSGRWRESLATVRDLERRHDAEAVVYGHDPDQLSRIEDGWP